MKKFILPAIFGFIFLVFLYGFPLFDRVNAQAKKPLGCREFEKVLGSKECPHWVIRDDEKGLWCGQSFGELIHLPPEGDAVSLYKNRPPDYTLLPETASCPLKESGKADVPFIAVFDEGPISFVGTIGFDTAASSEQIQAITGIEFKKLLGREPSISSALEKEAWAFEPEYIPPNNTNQGEDQIVLVKGQGRTDDLWDKSLFIGEYQQYVTMVRFTDVSTDETTGKVTLCWHAQGRDCGTIINASSQTEIKFLKPVQDKETQELKRMVKLNKGELEIKVKQANKKEKFGVQTDFLDLYVIGTHFWVTHDPDKKYTLVGVYDGTVEVTTKDGKTTSVSPEGDPSTGSGQVKPGIVAVRPTTRVNWKPIILIALVIVALVIFFKKRR